MKKLFKRLVLEEWVRLIKERTFDPQHFAVKSKDDAFLTKGRRDNEMEDDIVPSNLISIPAQELKPSQSEIFLGKSLGMAILGIAGGNLEAVISADGYILDGHHRWCSTMLAAPDADVIGTKIDMPIDQLIPVLRAVGDAYGNPRRGEPEGGDISVYDATPEDLKAMIETGKYMEPKFYNKEKAERWLRSIGGYSVLIRRMRTIQSIKPPPDAPARNQMPVLDPKKGQVTNASKRMRVGAIDVFEPYAEK